MKTFNNMPITSKSQSLSTKNVALTSCFAAMYVVFSFWNIFPVIGADNKFISAATITAPLIGIILGPIYGVLSITLGGIASAFLSPSGFFGPLSFLPHAAAAFASGILITGKRILCIVLYFLLFLIYAFFPLNGPAWLWPLMLWFDLIGLIIVSSPLQIRAIKYLNGTTSSLHLGLGVCVTCLSATLFGHVTGNIMFEAMKIFYLPMNIDGWRTTWQALTFLYPIERIMIVAVVTIVGTTLIKTLKSMA